MDLKEKEYIDDNIRKGIDSAIQALTILIHGMMRDQQKHQEHEIQSRVVFKEEMIQTVKTTVNGKIDRLQDDVSEIKPLLKELKDAKIGRQFVAGWFKKTAVWAGIISTIGGGVYAIKQFFIWFLK